MGNVFDISLWKDSSHSAQEVILSRTGAHEIGHILGLRDIDSIEGDSSKYHHEEILMGYSRFLTETRQTEITYKDIAVVAITRDITMINNICGSMIQRGLQLVNVN